MTDRRGARPHVRRAMFQFPWAIDPNLAIRYSVRAMTEMRVYIETWGCQMNRHQSEGIAGVVRRAGHRIVDSVSKADVVLFNGCMVRQKAEEKVYGRIGAVVEERRWRPVVLGIGGCLGQIRRESLLSRLPAVDFVFGAYGHGRLPELIDRAVSRRTPFVTLPEGTSIDEIPSSRMSRVTAMVTIAEGCSNYCSYCIVPYARGPMRSRDPEAILAEVEQAVSEGYREILLLGQNVNSYGRDRPAFGGFVSLLTRVASIGPTRIRFTSSHPRDLTIELLMAMARWPEICPHLHVACQSGSDRILREMNRGYTRDEFLEKARRAREIVPGMNLTTDLIVGFPGETDEDFDASLDLVDRGRFGSIFVAKYSPRPGTRSATLADDVSEEVKSERLRRILERERVIALEENRRFVGEVVEVLIDGVSRSGGWRGRAADHRTVDVRVDEASGSLSSGALVDVLVESASSASLEGAIREPVTAASAAKERR